MLSLFRYCGTAPFGEVSALSALLSLLALGLPAPMEQQPALAAPRQNYYHFLMTVSNLTSEPSNIV